MDPGGFTRPGGAATYVAASTSESGSKVVLYLGGAKESRGGVLADGNLHSAKA